MIVRGLIKFVPARLFFLALPGSCLTTNCKCYYCKHLTFSVSSPNAWMLAVNFWRHNANLSLFFSPNFLQKKVFFAGELPMKISHQTDSRMN